MTLALQMPEVQTRADANNKGGRRFSGELHPSAGAVFVFTAIVCRMAASKNKRSVGHLL